MTSNENTSPIRWNLRSLMAEAGMYQTTDLIGPLHSYGVNLSREQVFRLVTKTPERLNTTVLAALCEIFTCTPTDLITVLPTAKSAAKRKVSGSRGMTAEVPHLRPVTARIHRPPEA